MDVFNIDQQANQIGSSLVDSIVIKAINSHNKLNHNHHNHRHNSSSNDLVVTQVNCDPSADFNLNFFDTPDDSSTQGGFSDPGSVESVCSPPPIFDNGSKIVVKAFENNNCVENKFYQGVYNCFSLIFIYSMGCKITLVGPLMASF